MAWVRMALPLLRYEERANRGCDQPGRRRRASIDGSFAAKACLSRPHCLNTSEPCVEWMPNSGGTETKEQGDDW